MVGILERHSFFIGTPFVMTEIQLHRELSTLQPWQPKLLVILGNLYLRVNTKLFGLILHSF